MSGTKKKSIQQKKPPEKVKKHKRKTKTGFSEILPAALLTVCLIAVSVIISMVFIKVSPDEVSRSDSPSPPDFDSTASPTAVISETMSMEDPGTVEPEITVQKSTAIAAQSEKKPDLPSPAPEKAKTTVENAPAARPESSQPKTPVVKTPTVKTPTPVTEVPARPAAITEQPPKPIKKGTIVLVIDDAGNNLQELGPFLSFPGPLTIAVLPGLPHSAEAARRIRSAGKEVFLHQPMEATGGQAPGPGAIYSGMDSGEILAILHQNIAEIGPVAGINNHQGSRITADRHAMETVLTFCREQGIYFLDSRTTPETAAPAVAQDLGIKIGERNIFIDNEQDRISMNNAVQNGLVLAAARGSAVMIGHTWSPELAPLLTELHQNLVDQGYVFATAADLIKN